MESENGQCAKCGAPYGKRRRCYKCNGGGSPKAGETRKCGTCGESFYAPRWKLNDVERNQGAYCSRECKHEALRKYAALPDGQKQCTKCGLVKALEDFPADERTASGKQSACRDCAREASALWREKNPEQYEVLKKTTRTERQKLRRFELHLEQAYGLTLVQYQEILARQGGVCAICKNGHVGRGSQLHVDHCHETGRVRGLLCGNCNTLIGLAKEDQERLYSAARYLQQAAQFQT